VSPATQGRAGSALAFRGCYFRRLDAAGFSGSSTAKTGLGLTSTIADEYQFSFATMILTGNVCDT
jgi:hypothetical protein